jgi:predicted CoA-binding protein
MKKTVVIGASTNPERYAHRAVRELRYHGHPVIALGLKPGQIADVNIHTDRPQIDHVDTVTLYVGPANQEFWQDYILQLKPKRVIFNPGTENSAFAKLLESKGIASEESCTLVLLSIGNY